MEVIIMGNDFFEEELNLSEILECTADCSSFCIDCTLGWNINLEKEAKN